MIEKLHIKNFRTYIDQEIRFFSGVNIIKGITNNGKTNIKRAIELSVFGTPRGCPFYPKHLDSGSTEVEIKSNKGKAKIKKDVSVTRRGTKKLNKTSFVINGKELSVTGIDVPIEVKSVLNISELNIQSKQNIFIDQRPTEIAAMINELCGAEEIEKRINAYNGILRKNDKRVKELNQEIVALDSIIETATPKIDYFEKSISVIGMLSKKQDKNEKSIFLIQSYRSVFDKLAESNKYKSSISLFLEEIQSIESEQQEMKLKARTVDGYIRSSRKTKSVKPLQKSVNKTVSDIESSKKELDQTKTQSNLLDALAKNKSFSFDWDAVENGIDKLKKNWIMIEKIYDFLTVESNIEEAKEEAFAVEAELKAYIEQNPTCDVCGSQLRVDDLL